METYRIWEFQCSSASRKFLKPIANDVLATGAEVSVLFSEPKIPQCSNRDRSASVGRVSVLFSEPKIPQPFVEIAAGT